MYVQEVTHDFLQIHTFFKAVHGKIGARGDNYPEWSVFQTLLIEVFDMSRESTAHPDFMCSEIAWMNATTPGSRYGLFSKTIAFAMGAKMKWCRVCARLFTGGRSLWMPHEDDPEPTQELDHMTRCKTHMPATLLRSPVHFVIW